VTPTVSPPSFPGGAPSRQARIPSRGHPDSLRIRARPDSARYHRAKTPNLSRTEPIRHIPKKRRFRAGFFGPLSTSGSFATYRTARTDRPRPPGIALS